ncbi:MAG: MATE family efflux transporter [Kangiellaceae bacterium]|nr:MATE family efflux transporter [Kangiellaceae bacterium]
MKDLTNGSIPRHIVAMALPIAIGMIVQTVYFLIDLYFVGQLGMTALAGVNAAGNVTFLILGLTQILGVGTVALISHAVGRKDQANANKIFNQAIGLSFLFGLVTLALGYGLAETYLQAISNDTATIEAGKTYLYWFIPNLALQFALVAISSALRGTGIVKPTMVVQLISIIINIILSPILIAGWFTGYPMGVAGAGLASSIAILAAVFMLWYYFHKLEDYVQVDGKQFKPDWTLWKKIISIGFPAGGEFLLMFFYMGVIYWLIQGFGPSAQAGFGLGSKVMQAVFVPALALAFALPAVVGQNFGAQKYERVQRCFTSAVGMISGLMFLLTLVALFSGEWLLSFFSNDVEVLAVGLGFLSLIAFNFIPSGIIFTCSGLLQGLGNTWPAFYSMASRLILFVVPAIWLTQQPGFEIKQVWYLSIATTIVQAIISVLLVRREMKIKLVSSEPQDVTESIA